MKKERIEMIEKYSAQNIITDLIDSLLSRLPNELDETIVPGAIPTGFDVLDRFIAGGGLCPGQLLTIAARPSVGKTSFVVSLIRNMLRDGKKILFFSLQLSSHDISVRLLAGITHISIIDIEYGNLSGDGELLRVMDAAENLYDKSLHIIDMPMMSISELKEIAKTVIGMDQLDCILIDGIKHIDMKAPSSVKRCEKIARKLKELAINLSIPVVVTMQYPHDKKEREPSAAYVFPEAKFLMRESDIYLFLHRKSVLSDEEFQKNGEDSSGNAVFQATKVICTKNTNGLTGSFKIGYNIKSSSFENIVQTVDFVESSISEI